MKKPIYLALAAMAIATIPMTANAQFSSTTTNTLIPVRCSAVCVIDGDSVDFGLDMIVGRNFPSYRWNDVSPASSATCLRIAKLQACRQTHYGWLDRTYRCEGFNLAIYPNGYGNFEHTTVRINCPG